MNRQDRSESVEPRVSGPVRAFTLAVVVGWVAIGAVFLTIMYPGMEGTALIWILLAILLLLIPLLVGTVVAGWREGAPHRPRTLGLAAAGGIAMSWLNVLALWIWELLRFPGQDLASAQADPWDVLGILLVPALVGAALGAVGSVLWGLFAHRSQRLRVHAR